MNSTSSTLEDFEDVAIRENTDPAKIDNELVCPHCDGAMCDVEPGDTLGTLVRVARDHFLACTEAVAR